MRQRKYKSNRDFIDLIWMLNEQWAKRSVGICFGYCSRFQVWFTHYHSVALILCPRLFTITNKRLGKGIFIWQIALESLNFGQRLGGGWWPIISHIGKFFSPSGCRDLNSAKLCQVWLNSAQIPASRPKSHPQDPNPSLKAQIPASRLKSQPRGSNPSLEPRNL